MAPPATAWKDWEFFYWEKLVARRSPSWTPINLPPVFWLIVCRSMSTGEFKLWNGRYWNFSPAKRKRAPHTLMLGCCVIGTSSPSNGAAYIRKLPMGCTPVPKSINGCFTNAPRRYVGKGKFGFRQNGRLNSVTQVPGLRYPSKL